MRLAWALVHSRQPDDVNRGIGMLEGKDACISLRAYLVFIHTIESKSMLNMYLRINMTTVSLG